MPGVSSTGDKPVVIPSDVDKFVFCGGCRKNIEESDEDYQSLGVALDYEIRWHSACYNCDSCAKSLINVERKKAERTGNDTKYRLYCGQCYIKKFAPGCSRCKDKIPEGESWQVFGGSFYHNECYVCENCQQSLLQGVVVDDDEWLCSPCFEARRNFEKSATEEHDAIMAQLQSMISQAAGKQ